MHSKWKKNTSIFLLSQAISLFGSALVQYAITWHITLSTQSGFYTTIAIVCGFLPTLFLSPFAGVWADRYNRKTLIVLADGGIALSTLVLALLYMSGYRELWLLFAALAIRALGGAVQTPCINAMLPDIVPTEHLTRVNGLNSSIQSFITLASPMVSGALMGFASLEAIFFIDVITAGLAIFILMAFLKIEKKEKPAAQSHAARGYLAELKEGFAYIGRLPWLKNFFVFLGLFFIVIGPLSFLTPLQVARNYGDDVWRLTAIEVVFSVGMMLGGVIMASWGGFSNRTKTMASAAVLMGVLACGFALPIGFWPYIVIMGVIGLTMPMFNTPAIVLLQEKVDPAYLGRVFSIMSMITSTITPLGMMVFGPLADVIAIEWLLLFSGTCVALIALAIFTNRPLLQIGETAAKEASQP
ncbi:MFS transporter [Clostridia bacterium OttesenSCG-928-O13]|nr:MFS transporter [Clostridia bacterium OttesenSCG-928-O13]